MGRLISPLAACDRSAILAIEGATPMSSLRHCSFAPIAAVSMSNSEEPVAPDRLQFSLRHLFLLVALAAVVVCGLMWKIIPLGLTPIAFALALVVLDLLHGRGED